MEKQTEEWKEKERCKYREKKIGRERGVRERKRGNKDRQKNAFKRRKEKQLEKSQNMKFMYR